MAASQHGVISRAQLSAVGLSSRTIAGWIGRGTLLRKAPRVYSLGQHAPTVEQKLFIAVLFAGPGAMLSHMTAAWWNGLIDYAPRRLIQVSTPRQVKPLQGIQVFERRHLKRCIHRDLPVTTLEQIILDLAATLEFRLLRKALANLDYREQLDIRALEALCGRGIPGSANLRRALEEHQPLLAHTNGRFEENFVTWCERFKVPLPRVNVRVHGVLVDAYWPDAKLVVELDGLKAHKSPARMRRDKRNELTLREQGLAVIRYDWPLLHERPKRVRDDLMSNLGRSL